MRYTTKYCPGCCQNLRPFSNCCFEDCCERFGCNNEKHNPPNKFENQFCCNLGCQNIAYFVAGIIFANNKR